MARYAIVRQDGEVDQAEGTSVQDVSDRYGWPGNGTIELWDSGKHDSKARHTFDSVEHQGELLNDKPTKAEKKASTIAAAKAADDSADAEGK